MKVIISGYGKMGHMVEAALQRRGIELVCASEDICSIPKGTISQASSLGMKRPGKARMLASLC